MSNEKSKKGKFYGNVYFDKLITDGAITLLHQREMAAKKAGNDAIWHRTYKLDEREVLFLVPNGAELEIKELEVTGLYAHIGKAGENVNGVDIHLRGELARSMKPGDVVHVRAVICLKVWEPVGARERGVSKTDKDVFANYAIYIDLHRVEVAGTAPAHQLVVLDTNADDYRTSEHGVARGIRRDIVDPQAGVFAHESRHDKGMIRDTHIVLNPIQPKSVQPGGDATATTTPQPEGAKIVMATITVPLPRGSNVVPKGTVPKPQRQAVAPSSRVQVGQNLRVSVGADGLASLIKEAGLAPKPQAAPAT